MLRVITGRYSASPASSEIVNAFVPNPLPPVPPLELTDARQYLLERATLAIGRLDSVSTLPPSQPLVSY